MDSAWRTRPPRHLIPIGLAASVMFSGCLHGSESTPEPLRQPVEFETLVASSWLPAATPGRVSVRFLVGNNGCWRLDRLDLTVEGRTIRVDGTAIHPNLPGVGCTRLKVFGDVDLEIPGLATGTYEVVAGPLRTDLVVSDDDREPADQAAIRGRIEGYQDAPEGCAVVFSRQQWLLAGLPGGLGSGWYLVHGDLQAEDPCGALALPGGTSADRIVSVLEVEPTEALW